MRGSGCVLNTQSIGLWPFLSRSVSDYSLDARSSSQCGAWDKFGLAIEALKPMQRSPAALFDSGDRAGGLQTARRCLSLAVRASVRPAKPPGKIAAIGSAALREMSQGIGPSFVTIKPRAIDGAALAGI